MTVKIIGQSNYADMYGIYDNDNVLIGTVEHKIAGVEAGKSFPFSLFVKYSKRDIKKYWNQGLKNA